jgi:hypothetical protein
MLGVSFTITGSLLYCLHQRDHLDVFGHLAHGRAHAALAHAVRAAEVQLHAVGAGVFHHGQDAFPAFFLAGHHQRDDQRAVRPGLLHAGHLLQVGAQRPVGDQLDVVEPITRRSCASRWSSAVR